MKEDKDMARAWNTISSSYQQRYKIGTSKLHWGPLCPPESELNLLGDVYGKKVIEIGSGAGQNSIVLAKKKAIITAFDISKEQLKQGRKLARQEGVQINFVRGDFQCLRNYFDLNSFEIAMSSYALQYCSTLDSMKDTFKQIYEILRPNSFFVFSLDHPVRTIGYWDEKNDCFVLDNYFDRSVKEWYYDFPEKGISAKMRGSFKTIGDIVSGVIDAGFCLERLIEPEPVKEDPNSLFGIKSKYGKKKKKDPYSFNHLSRIPGTLIIKAKKIS